MYSSPPTSSILISQTQIQEFSMERTSQALFNKLGTKSMGVIFYNVPQPLEAVLQSIVETEIDAIFVIAT